MSCVHPTRRRVRLRARVAVRCALVALAAPVAVLPGCGDRSPASSPSRPDVLLITIDTIRADAIGCYGRSDARTPNIDRLAASGAFFEYAFSPRGATLPALTTVLTGVSPLAHGVVGNDYAIQTKQPTLAEMLKGEGYRTAAFLTNQCVTIVERDDHVGRGFDEKVCAKTDSEFQYEWDERATELALKWLDDAKNDEPRFLWVHYMDPHGTHLPRMEYYRGARDPAAVLEGQADQLIEYEVEDVTPPAEFLETLLALYDAEIENVDRLIGQVVDAFRARSRGAPVIVLAGDHGEEFYQHNNFRGHGESVYDSVLRVPLILSAPGVEPGLAPTVFAELQDIVPTVIEMLGIQPSVRLEGESLLPRMRQYPDKQGGFGQAFAIWDPEIITVRRPRYRYVWNKNPGGQAFIDAFQYRSRFEFFTEPELMFDLVTDPEERVNLLKDGVDALPEHIAATRRAMRKQIQDWLQHERHLSLQPSAIVDERLDAELRQLGYK